jgi:hypothetical protein
MHTTTVHEGQALAFSDHAALARSTDSLGLGSRGGAWHVAAMWYPCVTGSCRMTHSCAQHMRRHAEDTTSHSARSMLALSQPASRRGCSLASALVAVSAMRMLNLAAFAGDCLLVCCYLPACGPRNIVRSHASTATNVAIVLAVTSVAAAASAPAD